MNLPRKRMKQIVSLTTAAVLVLISCSPLLSTKVNAGTLTNAKVTISDSRAGHTNTTYAFSFVPTASTAIKTVNILFCQEPNGSACTAPAGLDVGTPTLSAGDGIDGTGTRTVTNPLDPAKNAIRVVIQTPAAQTTTPITLTFTGITNSTTANSTQYIRVETEDDTSTLIDQGRMGVAVLASSAISMTAGVGATFSFSVAGVDSAGCTVNGSTCTVTTTATTIPFGYLADGVPAIGAHDVSVTTNASNGYTVTVKTLADPPLADGTNNIDVFPQDNASPAVWSAPAGGTKNVNTGFFGYTTESTTLGTGTADRFSGNKWAGGTGGGTPITSPAEVAHSATGTETAQITRVGWQAEVNGLQPPGGYTGTVVLVATPTY